MELRTGKNLYEKRFKVAAAARRGGLRPLPVASLFEKQKFFGFRKRTGLNSIKINTA